MQDKVNMFVCFKNGEAGNTMKNQLGDRAAFKPNIVSFMVFMYSDLDLLLFSLHLI